MLKALYAEIGSAARRGEGRRPQPNAGCGAARRRSRPLARQSGRGDVPRRARRLNKPGSEKETWHVEFDLAGSGLDYAVGDAFGALPDQRSGAGRCRSSRRSARRRISRSAAARLREVLIDGVSLVARARHAVPAVLLHHRRRAAAEGQGAGRGRRPRRRCRDARRAGGAREVPRRAARPGSLHRSARSAAAAALFDLLLAQGRTRAASRSRSMPCATTSASARGSASPRPSSPTASSPATSSGSMCRRRSASACRPIRRCRSS